LWHLKRGEFTVAEKFFRKAIERLTRRNGNPYDVEAFYNLGLCLRHLGRNDEAYDAFYKSCWNQAWMAAGYHALAEIDCCRKNWTTALEHLNRSLRFNTDNLRARNLKVIILRKLKRAAEAEALLGETIALDPLDWWTRHLNGEKLVCDSQLALDIAHDFVRAGFYKEGLFLLCLKAADSAMLSISKRNSESEVLPTQCFGAKPLLQYTIGWLLEKSGGVKSPNGNYRVGGILPPDYCFPSRLEEIAILESAMRANPRDAKAPYYLGNLFYDRRRHAEAVSLWETSARLDPFFLIVWRNLGMGYFNISKNPAKARTAYDKAFQGNPNDARLLFERDQLWKRLGEKPAKRLRELENYPHLVSQRDDLTVELCALLNQTGQHVEAMQLLAERKFQPWEGGEGAALGQHVRTHLALGREALAHHDYPCATCHFEAALKSPSNLGEAKHLLANQSDIHYWLGVALDLLGDRKSARNHWQVAANFKGDFQEMSVRAFSEMTFYSALSWERLGQTAKAKKLLSELLAYAEKLAKTSAKIDYFATSLPTMLLFEEDLQFRQETNALLLQAQARLGLGQKMRAKGLLKKVLQRDPNHALAADLWTEYFQRKQKS
jgi:tetratricopeptide (TPR) repeat protein